MRTPAARWAAAARVRGDRGTRQDRGVRGGHAVAEPGLPPGPDAIIPPTFLISSSLWAPEGAAVDVGFDRKRLLHGEQEFVFHGPPPRAGQVLTVSDQIVDRYEKPGKRGGMMRFAVVVTEYRGEDGTLVAEARRTLIETAPKGRRVLMQVRGRREGRGQGVRPADDPHVRPVRGRVRRLQPDAL